MKKGPWFVVAMEVGREYIVPGGSGRIVVHRCLMAAHQDHVGPPELQKMICVCRLEPSWFLEACYGSNKKARHGLHCLQLFSCHSDSTPIVVTQVWGAQLRAWLETHSV